MAQKNITVTVKPDGTVAIEANNFQGVGCTAATEGLERVLAGPAGVSESDRQRKPDFYQSIGNTGRMTG